MRIEYLAPAVMDDLLRIETEISELSGASMEFLQQVSCGGRELVTANVLVASVCGGRAARIPDDLRRRLQTLLGSAWTIRLGGARIERPIKTRGQRIHTLAQSKFEITDIGARGQSAHGFAQTVMIVMQKR